jgi:hypothetical protein
MVIGGYTYGGHYVGGVAGGVAIPFLGAQDPIGAVISYLNSQPGIINLVESRVYGLELPKADAENMPQQSIVINPAGGIGQASFIETFKIRLDFFCYGETPYDAWRVYLALHIVLKQMDRNVTASTLLLSFIHSAGPFPSRNTLAEWPVIIDTWILEFHTTECP